MNDVTRRRALLAVAVVIAGGAFAFLAFGDLGENLVYYWSPTELQAAGDDAYSASIRLGGLVEEGTIERGRDGLTLNFRVTDGETSIPVHAETVPPAMFREGIGVVLEGTMARSGTFETNRLMVKHDNEYQAPDVEDDRSMDEIMKTLQFESNDT